QLSRHIFDGQGPVVRQARLRAYRSIFRIPRRNHISRELVRPSFELWQLRLDSCPGMNQDEAAKARNLAEPVPAISDYDAVSGIYFGMPEDGPAGLRVPALGINEAKAE